MLVIIGLIIGGVLVGQDLVSTAATRATITQKEKYDTAVNTFKNKYGGVPGDLALTSANQFGFYTPAACNGTQGDRDGNGLIEGNNSIAPLQQGGGETALFWSDLSTAGFADGQFSTANVTCNANIQILPTQMPNYFPTAKIGNGNYLYVYSINGINWFGLSAATSVTGCCNIMVSNAKIPVNQAYNMDKKIDDGLPTTGNVVAVYLNGSYIATSTAPNGNPDTASTCYNNSTNIYSTNISNGSNPNCALSFKMQGAAR